MLSLSHKKALYILKDNSKLFHVHSFCRKIVVFEFDMKERKLKNVYKRENLDETLEEIDGSIISFKPFEKSTSNYRKRFLLRKRVEKALNFYLNRRTFHTAVGYKLKEMFKSEHKALDVLRYFNFETLRKNIDWNYVLKSPDYFQYFITVYYRQINFDEIHPYLKTKFNFIVLEDYYKLDPLGKIFFLLGRNCFSTVFDIVDSVFYWHKKADKLDFQILSIPLKRNPWAFPFYENEE